MLIGSQLERREVLGEIFCLLHTLNRRQTPSGFVGVFYHLSSALALFTTAATFKAGDPSNIPGINILYALSSLDLLYTVYFFIIYTEFFKRTFAGNYYFLWNVFFFDD